MHFSSMTTAPRNAASTFPFLPFESTRQIVVKDRTRGQARIHKIFLMLCHSEMDAEIFSCPHRTNGAISYYVYTWTLMHLPERHR